MAAGNNSIVKAKIGSWITLAEWDYINEVWTPICVKTEQVDGERIKADTFYKLINGEFKVVEEQNDTERNRQSEQLIDAEV